MNTRKLNLLCNEWEIDNMEDYKLHFARRDTGNEHGEEPLDLWKDSYCHLKGWQEAKQEEHIYGRPYIFSLVQYYTKPDIWLFVGTFEVIKEITHGDGEISYKTEPRWEAEDWIDKLLIRYKYRAQQPRVYLEDYYEKFEIYHELKQPYSGRDDPYAW